MSALALSMAAPLMGAADAPAIATRLIAALVRIEKMTLRIARSLFVSLHDLVFTQTSASQSSILSQSQEVKSRH
jgi:hypothetical protein